MQKAKNKSDENDNQPRKTGQRPVQQDTLRRGLLHQHRREQGHLWCLDRAPDVQDGFFQFLFLSPRQWLCAVKLPQNRVTGRYGAPPVAAPATGMARGRSETGLHLSYLSRRLYAHVHRRQVLRLSPAVLLSDRHATVPVCRAGRTGGIYAPLGEDKTGAADPVADTYSLIVSVLYYLLVVINRAYAKTYRLPVEVPKNNYAFQFKDLLEKHIRDMQRVQEYADILRVSRITLNNSVVAQFGVSATHLLKQRLLEELKNELLFSDRNVSQLADEFHFSDPSHLMRFFKQQTGKTFTQYITDYQKGIYE